MHYKTLAILLALSKIYMQYTVLNLDSNMDVNVDIVIQIYLVIQQLPIILKEVQYGKNGMVHVQIQYCFNLN